MPPRKANKNPAGEIMENAVEAGDVPRPKRKKAPTKNVIEEGEEMKQIRLPRAAKANKMQEIDSKDADANGDVDKKPSARSNVANSKKAALATKQTSKVTSKRGKGDAELPPEAEDAEDDADVPAKKSRAKEPVKKAGMVVSDEPKTKQKGRTKKNAAPDNTNIDAPPVKKGRGTNKNTGLDKNKDVDEQVEDETVTAQKKGRTQKKPAAKPVVKKSRGKKDTAVKEVEEKMDLKEDEEAGATIVNGDKENEKANLEETEPVPAAKKGNTVKKKADTIVQKKVTKLRGKAATALADAATASSDSSDGNIKETSTTKPVKGRAKKTTKDTAAVTTGRKNQRKKISAKTDAEIAENDEESEETMVEEKEDTDDVNVQTESRHLSSESSDDKLGQQESQSNETKSPETESDNWKSLLAVKNENEW